MKQTIYLYSELGHCRSKITGKPWGKTVSLNRHMQTGFGAQCSLLSSRYCTSNFPLSHVIKSTSSGLKMDGTYKPFYKINLSTTLT